MASLKWRIHGNIETSHSWLAHGKPKMAQQWLALSGPFQVGSGQPDAISAICCHNRNHKWAIYVMFTGKWVGHAIHGTILAHICLLDQVFMTTRQNFSYTFLRSWPCMAQFDSSYIRAARFDPTLVLTQSSWKVFFNFHQEIQISLFLEGRPGFILNFCGRKGHLPTREAQFCP